VLQNLSLKHFRGFGSAFINSASRINLITGDNNVGKTAVLEAIWLMFADFSDGTDFMAGFRPRLGGPGDAEEFWRWLVFQRDFSQPSIVRAKLANDATFEASVEIQPPNGIAGQVSMTVSRNLLRMIGDATRHEGLMTLTLSNGDEWSSIQRNSLPLTLVSIPSSRPTPAEVADILNRAVSTTGGEEKLQEWLKLWDERLCKLRYLNLGHRVQAYVELNGLPDLIPLTQLGAAVYRLAYLFASLLARRAQIILIDEVENGLHHSTLEKYWQTLMRVANEHNFQLFATTHSEECITAAHRAAKELGNAELSIHRVQRVHGELEIVTITDQVVDTALTTGLELR
jgi:hypothetical protein